MWKVEITYNMNRAHRTYWVHTLDEALKLAREATLETKYDSYFPSDVTSVHIDWVE